MQLNEFKACLRLPPPRGRDFIIGDVHGCIHLLRDALKQAGFDFKNDRLLSVGDLVDRGEYSKEVLELLAEPWFFAVRGNHEQMAIEYAMLNKNGMITTLDYEDAIGNGQAWFVALPIEEQLKYADLFDKMPIAMEIQTERGLVGLVHAEVLPNYDWRGFIEALELNDPVAWEGALWERDKVKSSDERQVEGVGRLFSGHTPILKPVQLGNQVFIDTGGVFKVLGQSPTEKLCFTLVDSVAATVPNYEIQKQPSGFFQVWDEAPAEFMTFAEEDNYHRQLRYQEAFMRRRQRAGI